MVRLGWIAPAKGMSPIVTELRCFFGVASLTRVELAEPAAFRRTGRRTASPYALAAWLRRGKIVAAAVGTASFSKKNLMALIPRMRCMTNSTTPVFLNDLKRDLAATGVALTVVPCISGTYASGAMHRIGPEKAVIQLSNRGKYGDMFWFSLFHEIGHVLLHENAGVFIADRTEGDAKEIAADRFARDQLLPPTVFGKFVDAGDFTDRSVRRFARETGIHPGVVVGRLQHQKLVPQFRLNGLRVRYDFAQL
jgi:HTH-type transcriptional regulator/antitoxin HigA